MRMAKLGRRCTSALSMWQRLSFVPCAYMLPSMEKRWSQTYTIFCHSTDSSLLSPCFASPHLPSRPITADIISTVEFDHTGDYLATGDKGGRVVLFERNESVCSTCFGVAVRSGMQRI